ncbi:MAG: SPOR domain-containing protein [Nitrosomonadales bacterium]|nr:SPOR domain-containing protein [Nitrosomonadales bacterium]
MRTLFWILLLGNIIFFAAMQWGGGLIAGERLMQTQPSLHEEKIRLLTAPVAEPAEAPVAAAESAPLATKPDTRVCLEWGDFSGADLTRVTAALSALQLGDKLSQYQVEHTIGYWVYIPPQKSKAAVARKIEQLKARGVEEYFIVADAGPWLNAISLGVFKTREAAQSFYDDLQKTRDIRTAQIGERASKFKTTVFVLNGPDAAAMAELTRMQQDFPGSTLKNVPCAHIDNPG